MGICGGRCGGGLERVSGYRDEEREKKKYGWEYGGGTEESSEKSRVIWGGVGRRLKSEEVVRGGGG